MVIKSVKSVRKASETMFYMVREGYGVLGESYLAAMRRRQ